MSVKRLASARDIGDVNMPAQTRPRRAARKSTKAAGRDDQARDEILVEELEAVHNELGRVDNKSSMLLGFGAGGLLLGTTALPAGIGGWLFRAGLGFAAASIVPLLAVVRPRLGSGGFARHARRTVPEVESELSRVNPRTYRSEQLIALSRIAVRKFKLLRVAAGLQIVALVLTAAGALLFMV